VVDLVSIRSLACAGRLRDALDQCAGLWPVGESHPFRDLPPLELAEIQHEQGTLAWANARFDLAERALQRAYELRRAAVGDDHPLTLATIERQAALAHCLERHDDARKLFRRAIDGYTKTLSARAHETAVARRNFAAFLRDIGEFDAARKEIKVALALIRARVGRAHPSYAAALKVDALLAHCEGRNHEALEQAEGAIDICTRCHGASHPHTAGARLTAARAEHALGRGAEARAHVQQALADLEAAYGEHPLVAFALDCAAKIDLAFDGDLAIAERHARRSHAIYERVYPESYIGLPTLHSVLEHTSQWKAAGDLCELIAKRAAEDPAAAAEWLERARVDYSYASE
jgi:hypothetical protein